MAGPIVNPKSASHIRSNSLPSRSHPLTASVEEHLYRLRASEATSTSSSLCHKLSSLNELYECVDDMLLLPLIQQALSHERHDKCVEDVLDGSLNVLDVCGATRDVLSRMKECAQDLESSLRRRRGGETGLANEVGNYMISRKNISKMVCKCLKSLKKVEKKNGSMLLDKDRNLVAVVGVLRDVEQISLSVFESLLSFNSEPKARSKPEGWSLVSKLMQSKRIACVEEDANVNEMEKLNVALNALNSQKMSKHINVEQVQTLLKPLEALETSIQEFEVGVQGLFRRLVKMRVSLLNILSQ